MIEQINGTLKVTIGIIDNKEISIRTLEDNTVGYNLLNTSTFLLGQADRPRNKHGKSNEVVLSKINK